MNLAFLLVSQRNRKVFTYRSNVGVDNKRNFEQNSVDTKMITVICGTNRANSNTSLVVRFYENLLKSKNQEVEVLYLEDLPKDYVFHNDVLGNASPEFTNIVKSKIVPADKLVVISPEYNGGYTGALKAFIDGVWPENLKGKKVAMVGVASGRSGNLRGMDHLTNIFHYLKMDVIPFKLPISRIETLIDNGELVDVYTMETLDKHADQLIES